jgi:hypothetical protein
VREILGPLLVHGALLAAGLGVLRALGVISNLRSRRALAAVGLAYLVGVAATLGICVIVLVLGGPFTLVVFGVIAAVLAAPLAQDLRGWVRRPRGPRSLALPVSRLWSGRDAARWAVIATLAAFAVLAVVGLVSVSNLPIGLGDVDTWNQWTRKALLLFEGSHLPTAIFSFSGDVQYQAHYNINASYPLLLSLLEALDLRALGRADPQSIHLVLWLLGIGFVWAGGFIASRVTSAIVWAPVLTGAVVLAATRLLSGYADVPLGLYLGLGALQAGVWLESGQRRDLAVAALLLAGAASIKNEGTPGALLVLVFALVAALVAGRRRAARDLAVAAALLVIVAVLPWRLWVATHHVQTQEPLSRIVNPAYLVDNIGRVGPTVHAFSMQLGMTNQVTVFVSLALAMIAACLWERRRRMLAVFYLAALGGYFVALVWSEWIDTITPFAPLLHVTASRLVLPLAFIAVAAVLHLSGVYAPRGADPSPPAVGAGRRSA